MNDMDRLSVMSDRELLRELRGLGDLRAPSFLPGSILAEVGLADGYWHMETQFGRIYLAYNAGGISAVMPAADDESFERAFRARFQRTPMAVQKPPAKLARRVAEQLAGEGRQPLSYDLRGLTEFERAVLLKAMEIPRGEVRPYAWIAREIGHPGAVRAVGTALGNNPVPLLIPCHRVVRSDGAIGNYAFGGEMKRAVLREEGVEIEELERLVREGVRYFGSDTTHIYCYPTCRHARRVNPSHLVTFGSAGEASSAGYRPCHVCRPA
ncbi:MAG TPA: methylated-DNA--[protein]-cysteine S-methyltransferase [Chloroflexota bacterium]|nr:methylated-DNA--[protein]-cysteine S-methyltransferase [Chloroflexota bacterium]